jgi:hypothetical protein
MILSLPEAEQPLAKSAAVAHVPMVPYRQVCIARYSQPRSSNSETGLYVL